MFVVAFSLLGAVVAQNPIDDPGGFFDMIKDKVTAIVTGASDTCNNKYVTHPAIESVLCGSLVPPDITMRLGIKFGPETAYCKALACAYRAMGCPEPTYRIEAAIIKATGVAESCAEALGIEQCDTFAKFIAKNPMAKPQTKRLVDMKGDEIEQAKNVAADALRAYFPGQVEGLDELAPQSADKRQLQGIVDNLQVCSPLIAAGLQILESSVKLPVNVSTLLGPCGDICNYALCGLNILCADEALPLLKIVNAQRAGSCPDLTCASFVKPPPNACEINKVTCPPLPAGGFTPQTCPPPKVVVTPTKATINDCCPRCDEPCKNVNCPMPQCAEPKWPACVASVVQKYDQFDCCTQCIDPCATRRNQCAPPPASCQAPLILGPARPGDCCLSCQPKCAGVSCEGKPQSAAECPRGQRFEPPKNGANDNPNMCSDCCGKCVPVTGVTGANPVTLSASTYALSVVAACVAMLSIIV